MLKNYRIYTLASLLIFGVFGLSYYKFQEYKPHSLRQAQDIKGLETNRFSDIPFPADSEKIGVNMTSQGEQTTFHTPMTMKEVRDFYFNIFQNHNWEIESEGSYDDFIITKYKNENRIITVIAFDVADNDKTLVSIEVTPR